jgi:hypothetical protein
MMEAGLLLVASSTGAFVGLIVGSTFGRADGRRRISQEIANFVDEYEQVTDAVAGLDPHLIAMAKGMAGDL